MNIKRITASLLAASMLISGAALPAGADTLTRQPEASVSYYRLEALAKPVIKSAAAGQRSVRLRWKKVKGASGYKIYRKISGKWKCIKTVKGGGITTATLKGFNSRTKYTFKMRAYKKKSSGNIYSPYSALKSCKTQYGLGAGNYTNKAISIKFNRKLWSAKEGDFDIFDTGVIFRYKNTADGDEGAGGSVTYRKMPEGAKRDSLEAEANYYADENKNMYHPTYMKIEYGEAFGERCAYLWLTAEDPEVNPDTEIIDPDPLIMIYENHCLYYINSYYDHDSPNAAEYKAALDKVFGTLKLTYKNT